MDKLLELINRCKCGVYVTVNAHRDFYQTVEQYMSDFEDEIQDIPSDVYVKMKELDTIIELQWYPNTPVGFYIIYHYDLEMALDEALS